MIDTWNNSLRDPSCELFGSILGLYPHLAHNTTPSSHDNKKCLRHGQVYLGSKTTRSREALGHKEATSSLWAVASGLCTAAIPWVHTPPPWIENLSCCNCKDTIITQRYLFSISLVSRNLSFQNSKQTIYHYSTFPDNIVAIPPFSKCLMLLGEEHRWDWKGLEPEIRNYPQTIKGEFCSLLMEKTFWHLSTELNKTSTNLIFIRAPCYAPNLPKSWEYSEDHWTNCPLTPQMPFCKHSTGYTANTL